MKEQLRNWSGMCYNEEKKHALWGGTEEPMEPKQEPHVERFINQTGAIAEVLSVFYNSLIGRVPKDVALHLTGRMLDSILSRGSIGGMEAKLLADLQRRAMEQQKKQREVTKASVEQTEEPLRKAPEEKDSGTAAPAEGPKEDTDMPEKA